MPRLLILLLPFVKFPWAFEEKSGRAMEQAHGLLLNEEFYSKLSDAKKPAFFFEWLQFLQKLLVAASKVKHELFLKLWKCLCFCNFPKIQVMPIDMLTFDANPANLISPHYAWIPPILTEIPVKVPFKHYNALWFHYLLWHRVSNIQHSLKMYSF